MNLVRVNPPATEVLTLAEAKAHLRVDFADDDDLISGMVTAARELLEARIARAFVTTTFRAELDNFPGMYSDPRRPGWTYERNSPGPLLAFFFPRGSVQSVTSVVYTATDGTPTTLDPSLYRVQAGDAARLVPVYGHTWPATRFEPGAVQITFKAGYGDTADTVPAAVKAAVKVELSHLYANRGDAPAEVGIHPTAAILLAAESWGAYG